THHAPQASSETRNAIAAAIERRRAAEATMRDASAVLTAVDGLVQTEAKARAKLDTAMAAAADRIAGWAKGGANGEAPAPGADLAALQRELDAAAATTNAARISRPAFEAEQQAAHNAVIAARADIDRWVRAALLDEAAYIGRRIQSLYEPIAKLVNQLNALGEMFRRTPHAHAAENAIRAILDQPTPHPTQAEAEAQMPAWRDYAERLARDPDSMFDEKHWQEPEDVIGPITRGE
ncbi:MAG TPA: hypothetical protein VGL62_13485, partial [Vicinamibacterales bacterium]